MRDKLYAELREELELKAQVLKNRLGKIQGHLRHEDGPLSQDFAEQATERENDEVLEHLDEVGRAEYAQIRYALIAMDEGVYGECVECGEQIKEGRLRILPFTQMCVKCASELEQRAS